MIDIKTVGNREFSEICARKDKLERVLAKHHAKVQRVFERMTDYNNFYTKLFKGVFDLMKTDCKLELPVNRIQITSELGIDVIQGFSQSSFNDSVPTNSMPLSHDQIAQLSKVFRDYLIDTSRFRRKIDMMGVLFARTYSQIAELTLYDPLRVSEESDKAILYLTYPSDPLLHREVQNFGQDELMGDSISNISNRKLGLVRKLLLRREGKKENANVYVVNNPSLKISGKDISSYVRYHLQAEYDKRNPENARIRRECKYYADKAQQSAKLVVEPHVVFETASPEQTAESLGRFIESDIGQSCKEQYRLLTWKKQSHKPD